MFKGAESWHLCMLEMLAVDPRLLLSTKATSTIPKWAYFSKLLCFLSRSSFLLFFYSSFPCLSLTCSFSLSFFELAPPHPQNSVCFATKQHLDKQGFAPPCFFGCHCLSTVCCLCAMQAALVSVAASPVTLLVIGIADFSKHATPEVLRVMRDEVRSYLLLPSLLLGLCKAYMGFAGVYMQGCKQMHKQSTFFTQQGGRGGQTP